MALTKNHKNMNLNQRELKQIIDIVSRGINSYLMNAKSPSLIKCEQLGMGLMEIYKKILADLKIESPKLTKEDFVAAKEEAPKLQALQEKAEELKGEAIKEEETQKVEENLPIINQDGESL